MELSFHLSLISCPFRSKKIAQTTDQIVDALLVTDDMMTMVVVDLHLAAIHHVAIESDHQIEGEHLLATMVTTCIDDELLHHMDLLDETIMTTTSVVLLLPDIQNHILEELSHMVDRPVHVEVAAMATEGDMLVMRNAPDTNLC